MRAMSTMVTELACPEPFDKLRVTPASFAQRLVEKGRSAGYAGAFLSTLTIEFLSWALVLPAILLWSRCAIAQVTSDGTTNTIVNPNGNNFTILNGIEKGNNLFHNFNNFSVPTGGSARFDLINTPNITTIFSRVTGGNVSNINGLISTLNSSNPVSLFLMNPAGIVFGKDASLNIGGSFVGTTANSIKFADGVEFSAVNASGTPLLTISVPVGLQMGTNPGNITVQGTGHNVSLIGLSLLNRGANTTGLQVKPGNNIALVGGNITLNGGLLIAESGNINLTAFSNGQLNIGQGNSASYLIPTPSTTLGDIHLQSSALVDVSGVITGSAKLQGRQIQLQDGSAVISQNLGTQNGGSIEIQASQQLAIIGATPNLPSRLTTQSLGTGSAGDIYVQAPSIVIDRGGAIHTQTFSSASSGNITVKSSELQITGENAFRPDNRTSIANATFSSGNTGKISVSTGRLIIRNGSAVTAVTLGTGNVGEVIINASESIDLSGSIPGISKSDISAVSFGQGSGGNITINTPRLNISHGAGVTSATFASGNAGNITVNASEAIEITGTMNTQLSLFDNEAIASTATSTGGSLLQLLLGLPDQATGNGGDVIINTPRLSIKDAARISVASDSTGKAGTISLNANDVSLDNGAQIVASTASGNGGNLNLNLQEILLMRGGSLINTEAGSTGNGGNITINSPIIVGLENSDIIANAVQGNGGKINITTQGLFGLKYRDRLTPESDITASSEFGINGTVDINNFGVDPNSGLVELPENVTDSSQQIATGCAGSEGSRFVATGRGGIPENPTQQVTSDVYDGLRLRTWSDIRDISAYRKTGEVTAQIPLSSEVLVQATSWHRNTQGKIELVADKSPTQVQQPLTCAALPKS